MKKISWMAGLCLGLCLTAFELFARAAEDLESADALFGWFFLDQRLMRQVLMMMVVLTPNFGLRSTTKGFETLRLASDIKMGCDRCRCSGLYFAENITEGRAMLIFLKRSLRMRLVL